MRLMASRPAPRPDPTPCHGPFRWGRERGHQLAEPLLRGSPREAVRRRRPLDRTELALYLDSTTRHLPSGRQRRGARSAPPGRRGGTPQIHCAPDLRCRCSWRAVTRLPYAADAQLMSDSGTLAHVGPPRPSVSSNRRDESAVDPHGFRDNRRRHPIQTQLGRPKVRSRAVKPDELHRAIASPTGHGRSGEVVLAAIELTDAHLDLPIRVRCVTRNRFDDVLADAQTDGDAFELLEASSWQFHTAHLDDHGSRLLGRGIGTQLVPASLGPLRPETRKPRFSGAFVQRAREDSNL